MSDFEHFEGPTKKPVSNAPIIEACSKCNEHLVVHGGRLYCPACYKFITPLPPKSKPAISDAPMTPDKFARVLAVTLTPQPVDPPQVLNAIWVPDVLRMEKRIANRDAAIRSEAQVQIEDAKDIGRQTAEAILQSYLTGGMSTGFVHELTLPMLKKWKREAQAEALEQAETLCRDKAHELYCLTKTNLADEWEEAANEISSMSPLPNYRERIVAQARSEAYSDALGGAINALRSHGEHQAVAVIQKLQACEAIGLAAADAEKPAEGANG